MQTTTLSFENMHNHGLLFSELLRARQENFKVEQTWNQIESVGMEFDQYDTPLATWIAVHENGKILAGIRLTPTTTQCGIYSYMIRDAQRGLLDDIPESLLATDAPVAPDVFEVSRFFVADHITHSSRPNRAEIEARLMLALLDKCSEMNVSSVIGFGTAAMTRWMRSFGHNVAEAGPAVKIDGVDKQCHKMELAEHIH